MGFIIWFAVCFIPHLVSVESECPMGLQKNWKQCAWSRLDDGREYGRIKECVFSKHTQSTSLKVEYNGDFRTAGCLRCCKRWYFTFNGVECNPVPIAGIMHIQDNHGRTDFNVHRTGQIGGYCEGIARGTVTVGFHVGDCNGTEGGSADASTGWKSPARIMIEEVPPPQQ